MYDQLKTLLSATAFAVAALFPTGAATAQNALPRPPAVAYYYPAPGYYATTAGYVWIPSPGYYYTCRPPGRKQPPFARQGPTPADIAAPRPAAIPRRLRPLSPGITSTTLRRGVPPNPGSPPSAAPTRASFATTAAPPASTPRAPMAGPTPMNGVALERAQSGRRGEDEA